MTKGVAPNLQSNEAACVLIVEAICKAGYRPGPDIAIALDPAASSLASDGGYGLARSRGGRKTSEQMTDLYASWIATYPLAMLEDGLADDDWAGFKHHTATLGAQVEIVGDDLYVTNAQFIARGIKERSTNAVLIKLNQIGTVTETIEAIRMCQNAGWHFLTSHRSGETQDPFIADFAVAMGGARSRLGHCAGANGSQITTICWRSNICWAGKRLTPAHSIARAEQSGNRATTRWCC